ncbi:MAG: hypothetical protein ABI853_00155 [Sphingomicrobium sp.]
MTTERGPDHDFERQMAIARHVMKKDWVALRALALGDQHPGVDIEALLEMARKQRSGQADT